MTHSAHYIQWQNTHKQRLETQVSEVMSHWQTRYELGSAVLLSDKPELTLKLVQKHWRKLTRHNQKNRQNKTTAEDILQTTRLISRMQRVTFTTKNPSEEPDANFYILPTAKLSSFPSLCYTLYILDTLPEVASLHLLPAEALVVAYHSVESLTGFYGKTVLEEHLQTEEASLHRWLNSHHIVVDNLDGNIENINEALDSILSSNRLQNEFLLKTQQFLHRLALAQPVTLSPIQQTRLKSLQQLERHVRSLSPAFLTDHVLDSQNDDAFLLRELSTRPLLSIEALRNFIALQYQLGRTHLAAALERQAGYVSL